MSLFSCEIYSLKLKIDAHAQRQIAQHAQAQRRQMSENMSIPLRIENASTWCGMQR